MHDRVEARQVLRTLVADVTGARLVAGRLRPEVAAVVPAGVEADHLVAGLHEQRDEHGTYVAAVSVDKNLHLSYLPCAVTLGHR